MRHDFPIIKEEAIFISDAHESEKRGFFGLFLAKIEQGEIKTKQLFLMGDMFDMLIGGVSFSENMWKQYILQIENIAKNIEVYYFEGNHDFNLSVLFKNVKVITISKQPFLMKSNFGLIALSHGDNYEGFSYKIYTTFLRSKYSLFFLNTLDKILKNRITKKISYLLDKKQLFNKIDNFQKIIEKKVPKFNHEEIKYIAEGHYHQGVILNFENIDYINFASFSQNGIFYKLSQNEEIKFIPKYI